FDPLRNQLCPVDQTDRKFARRQSKSCQESATNERFVETTATLNRFRDFHSASANPFQEPIPLARWEGCRTAEDAVSPHQIIWLAAAVSKLNMIRHAIYRTTTKDRHDQRAYIRSSQGRDYARADRRDWRWNHLLLSRTSPPCSARTGRPGNGQT